ncbi:MarR family winged helix-turn-helix transcriptional regulator [Actinoplanes solisilvae]|uniref:MarR family winged helix-turn-helix transcriptional regulator n=1 Tax=Actinoplanes solisilvae TaxID=2486853 RepID=UPI000FDB6762|nr:MarR family transcriptional regulator [Actinoplanes solisilvae]
MNEEAGATIQDAGTAPARPRTAREGTAERLQRLPTRLLSLAALRSDRLVTEALARVDARKWHYAVLATLEQFGAASQAQLSDRTRIYSSDLVSVLNELADGGFVERGPDPADRRRNVVSLTAAGKRRLRKLDRVVAAVQDDVFGPLDATQRGQLARLLTVLVDSEGA